MRDKKILLILLILAVAAGLFFFRARGPKENGEVTKEVKPVIGSIRNSISTTGTVLPKNRLEVKPPVNGRIEEMLVKEGQKVKTSQPLAWMSSTERAALLDAARGQGEKAMEYWKEVYKAIPLLSPIDGEVIVAKMQPGQTITTAEAVVVLSDHLIIRAQVDETDIGKVKVGQEAVVSLDAYPQVKIKSTVEHIYYESKTVNNVTIYEVDLLPEDVPDFVRSGMNATIDFIQEKKENVLLIPTEALIKEKGQDYCLVKKPGAKETQKQAIKLGVADDKNVEIVSGVNTDDTIVIRSKKYKLPKDNVGTNPFTPFRRQSR